MSDNPEIQRAKELGAKQKEKGVTAFYFGEFKHKSVNAGQYIAAQIAEIKPDMVFVEVSPEKQDLLDSNAGLHQTNMGHLAIWTKDTNIKIIGVDIPEKEKAPLVKISNEYQKVNDEINKLISQAESLRKAGDEKAVAELEKKAEPLLAKGAELYKETTKVQQVRDDPKNNERIAKNIADHVEKFYHDNGRMPVFATSFGSAHLKDRHDINEMVRDDLESRGLPKYKETVIKVAEASKSGERTDVDRKYFGNFDYQVTVNKDDPLKKQNPETSFPPSLDKKEHGKEHGANQKPTPSGKEVRDVNPQGRKFSSNETAPETNHPDTEKRNAELERAKDIAENDPKVKKASESIQQNETPGNDLKQGNKQTPVIADNNRTNTHRTV